MIIKKSDNGDGYYYMYGNDYWITHMYIASRYIIAAIIINLY